jgi:hypothetical protein
MTRQFLLRCHFGWFIFVNGFLALESALGWGSDCATTLPWLCLANILAFSAIWADSERGTGP